MQKNKSITNTSLISKIFPTVMFAMSLALLKTEKVMIFMSLRASHMKSVAEVLCLIGSKGLNKQVPESDVFGNRLNIRVDYNI